MRPARGMGGGFNFAGIPRSIGILIAVTFFSSIAGAIGERNGLPLVNLAALLPTAVWEGEIWRLVTWVFFERDPISLIFACLMLYWFGRDLSTVWGARRFITIYLGFAAASGAVTCILALWWPTLMGMPYAGAWPVADAMIIAWALLYPDRQIMLYFVLPVGGRSLIYLTLGGTVLYAIFTGIHAFVPHFSAEGLMLLYARGFSPRRMLLRLKLSWMQRGSARKAKHLRVVDKDKNGDGDPPEYLN